MSFCLLLGFLVHMIWLTGFHGFPWVYLAHFYLLIFFALLHLGIGHHNIFFVCFFMRLSWSHDPRHEFPMLNRVAFIVVFFNFLKTFCYSVLSCLEIKLCNFFSK